MAGMTSQPSMGAIVACTKGTKLDTGESQTADGCFREVAEGGKLNGHGAASASAVSLMRRSISSITSPLPQNLLLCNVGDPKSKINPALNKPPSASLITASRRSPSRWQVSARCSGLEPK